MASGHIARLRGFYPRLRGGGDVPRSRMAASLAEGFYLRLRGGGDILVRKSAWINRAVSIHASAGEATRALLIEIRLQILFLSTPPRGRRQSDGVFTPAESIVSIHASAGEATPRRPPPSPAASVSIHASAGEATRLLSTRPRSPSMFLSTPPRGRRLDFRGAVPATCSFYPRLRGGGDAQKAVETGWRWRFLSTPPRGRRRPGPRRRRSRAAFLSTPPRGRRLLATRSR